MLVAMVDSMIWEAEALIRMAAELLVEEGRRMKGCRPKAEFGSSECLRFGDQKKVGNLLSFVVDFLWETLFPLWKARATSTRGHRPIVPPKMVEGAASVSMPGIERAIQGKLRGSGSLLHHASHGLPPPLREGG